MDEHETFLDIRRGSSSPFALVSVWAPSVVATLLSVLLYANDKVDGWTAMAVFLLSLLLSVLIYGCFYIYSRSVTLDDRGYLEKAAIAGYELWREEYELAEVFGFDVESTYDGEDRVVGRQVVLCLRDGQRKTGMAYRPTVQTRWVMNEMNRILENLKRRRAEGCDKASSD